MDEPRTGWSKRRLALLLAVPLTVVATWVSVAAAGGSGSPDRTRADIAKQKPAKVLKNRPGGAKFFQHDGRDCPLDGAKVTSVDV